MPQPGWRNWQTQRTQNPPTFGSWGFDSPSRHHTKTFGLMRLSGSGCFRGLVFARFTMPVTMPVAKF